VKALAACLAFAACAVAAEPRSTQARAEFIRSTPCPAPHGKRCPGYIIDHVIPLACGGVDAPSNMQWQTKADAAAKDKLERKGCEKPAGLRGM
jgi:hypothetical protein